MTAHRLAPSLNQLENAGLVRLAASLPDLAYAFRHGLIQDAAYGSLLRAQRQAWHLAAAEVLEAAFSASSVPHSAATDAAELAPILAHHFANAGENARAFPYLVSAGDAAFNRYGNLEAIDFYSRALEVANQAPRAIKRPLLAHLFARLGRALELSNQYQQAVEHYQRQEALAQQLDDQALEVASLTARATILSTANFVVDVEQAASLLERARGLAHQLGDRAAEAKISWTLLLNNTMSGGDVAERLEHGERALQLALELGERELLAFVYNDLWFAYAGSGRWSQGLDALKAGRAVCRELGNLPILCENLTRTAMSHLALGSYAEALDDMEQAYQTAEVAQNTDFRGLSLAFAGLIHLDRGDLAQAIEVSETAVTWGEQTGNVTVLIGTQADLARAYALLGDSEHALIVARRALEVAAKHFELLMAWPQSVLIRLHVGRGELAEAEAIQSAVLDYRTLQQRLSFMVPMWGNLALANIEVALALRQFGQARTLAIELVERLGDSDLRFLLPEARLRLGQAMLGEGQVADAQAALDTARREAETLGSRRLLWPILEALAEAAIRSNEPGQAAAYLNDARAIVNYIAAHAPTDRLRDSFLATAGFRRLVTAS
jgi:tetratricopeptide (TPR) repeat protein